MTTGRSLKGESARILKFIFNGMNGTGHDMIQINKMEWNRTGQDIYL